MPEPTHYRRRFLASAALLSTAGLSSAQTRAPAGCITDVAGIRAGHFTHTSRPTGCTVMIFDKGATAGVDVRGSAPGTRETDLLNPLNTVQQVNAILLTGGSAYGLDAASGIMRYLEEHGIGFRAGESIVPIVPAAVLFDLSVGNGKIRPDAAAGYAACQSAASRPLGLGNVGAGAGATVGKLFGMASAMKSGIGTASIRLGETDLVFGAVVALNAVGDVRDHRTGKLLAGARNRDGKTLRNTIAAMQNGDTIKTLVGTNSTIAVVATNAVFTKTQATKIAQMAHDGFARTINPTHTAYDGDTIFAAATGASATKVDVSTAGALAAECIALAVERAILSATGIPGLPAAQDLL